jgi:hypothetical protein
MIGLAAYALFFGFALWQLCLGAFAGRAISYHGKPVKRSDEPMTFWVTLAAWGAIMCISGSALLGTALHINRISN